MVAQPASVPAARRFVDDALTAWGRPELIDDVGLSVTELATNATLHSGSTFFDVELQADPDGVRVSVADSGVLPARLIASRADHTPDQVAHDLESSTGRGLFIVSALASRWGIDDGSGGTRVWADFDAGTELVSTPPEVTSGHGEPVAAAASTAVIRLVGCPPDLLLAHDDNLAEVARELRLFGMTNEDPDAVRSAEQIVEVVRLSALTWNAARLVARQGVQDGLAAVDIAVAVMDPADVPHKVRMLRQAVTTAEAMAGRGLLMTMPAPAPVQEWRDWVECEMTEQATTGREPVSFPAFLASRARHA